MVTFAWMSQHTVTWWASLALLAESLAMRPNRLLSQLAVLSLLSVGIAVGMPRASVPLGAVPHPVAPRDTFVSLVAPSQVPGAKALAAADRTGAASRARSMAHSSARSFAPLSAPDTAVTGASVATAVPATVVVVGVTWQQGTGQGVSVQYRSQQKGRWSAWSFIDADPAHGPDPGSAEAKNARAGSDPLVVTNATTVQVRTLGDGAHAPVQPKLMVVDPGASAEPGSGPCAGSASMKLHALHRPFCWERYCTLTPWPVPCCQVTPTTTTVAGTAVATEAPVTAVSGAESGAKERADEWAMARA